MPILFLDTHIWNYLVENDAYSDNRLQKAREHLVDGVQQGKWEVSCSLPVLQEVLAVYRKKPEKYEAIRTLLFEVVRNRWLKELKERYVAEIYNGGRLAPTSRYIDRELRRKVETLANKKKDVLDIGDITYKDGLDFKAGQEDAKKKIFADLGSPDGKAPKKISQAYEKWFKNDRDLEGWVLKVMEGGVTRKLFPASKLEGFKPTHINCPSAWQYVDFRQAKILLNLGHAQAIKESDVVDADIYACSPYYDILVTEDQRFKETINLVASENLAVYDFDQLLKMLDAV